MGLYDLDKLLFTLCFSNSKSNKKKYIYLDDLVQSICPYRTNTLKTHRKQWQKIQMST